MKAQTTSDSQVYVLISPTTKRWLIGGLGALFVIVIGWLIVHHEWKGEINATLKEVTDIKKTVQANTQTLGKIAKDISIMKGRAG